MVDEESRDVASEAAGGAPVNRDKRRSDPGVIEGEAASPGEAEATLLAPVDGGPAASGEEAAGPGSSAQEPEESAPSAWKAGDAAPSTRDALARQPGRRWPVAFVSGALGGLVVSALLGGAVYYFLAPKADLAEADANRLAAIESQARREDAAIADIDKRVAGIDQRVGAIEGSGSSAALAAIDKRVAALQQANETVDKRLGALQAANDAVDKRLGGLQSGNGAAATQAIQTLTGKVNDLSTDVDAARSEIPALQARVAKLETAPPQPAADLSAVNARLDKIEAQLTAAKNETRVALEKVSASDDPAAVAIVAASLRDKLVHGAPFKTELEGLERLGVEAAKLAPLKAVADGAPTDSALAADFEAVQSKVLAAAAPKQGQGGDAEAQNGSAEAQTGKKEPRSGLREELRGFGDRFLTHLRGLIQVRKLNEAAGNGLQALASQIEEDSRRGDVSAALAAFAKLPEASRQAASAWASAAEQRSAAQAAIESIREAAVAQLAKSGKP